MSDARALVERIADRVIPAVPVPFNADAAIDWEAHQLYVRWMAEQSVGGVALWAHTGRGLHLTTAQRAQVVAAWRAGLPDTPIVCGVGVPRDATLSEEPLARSDAVFRAVRTMAGEAAAAGADAVLVYPPRDLLSLPDVDGRIVAYHEAACDAGIPALAFFLYQAAGGVTYSASVLERILALDGVIGVKIATLDSVMTYQDVMQTVAGSDSALAITGEDRFLGYSLMAGARGALIGMAAAVTDGPARLLESWRVRDLESFLAWSKRIDAFAADTFRHPMEGYVQRMLWALEADGVFPREVFDPWRPKLDPGDRDRVFAAVRRFRDS